jgi:hypothetical protein
MVMKNWYRMNRNVPPFYPVQTEQKVGRLEERMRRTMKEKQELRGGGIYDGCWRLKFARTSTEVLFIGQRLQDGASTVDAREGDAVTGPVDSNVMKLQGEDEQSRNSDGGGECSGGNAGVRQRRIRNQA